MAIAGIEVGLPSSVDDVTPEWLTSVLRTSGAIAESNAVVAADVAPFAVGIGFLSDLFQATLSYQDEDGAAPATVIVKFATEIDTQRGIADALQFYQRELRFYREVAPELSFRTPTVHAAVMSESNTDFVLVMEDLSAATGFDQISGASAEQSILAAKGAAQLHARYWNEDLTSLQETFLPFDNPVYRTVLPDIFAGGWDRAKQEAGDLMSDEIVAFGDRFGELVSYFIDQIDSVSTTLIHGDWRADNLMVDEDGQLIAIDFQITGTGAPTYDLAYFLSQSVEPEVRAESGEAIVAAYYASLDAEGIEYDRSELEEVFRLATAWCLIYPVSMFTSWDALPENSRELARAILHRSATAIEDTDALSLLP